MKYLSVGDLLYRLVYLPEIHLEVYEIERFDANIFHFNCTYIHTRPIIGERIGFWIESDTNLNKLIKVRNETYHYYKRNVTESYFLTTNLELAIKRLNILIKYKPKNT